MEPSRPRVALWIDGDNSASISIPSLLAEAGKLGDVMLRRVYGNWSLSSMHAWQKIAPHYGLEQRHQGQTTPGNNATDIALVVDAMDILYSGAIEHFCLVTSDSDYTPLALRLRSAGCQVLGIGKLTTPLALQTTCTEFVSTDELLSRPLQPFPAAQPTTTLASVIDASVSAASPPGAVASMMTAFPLSTEPLALLLSSRLRTLVSISRTTSQRYRAPRLRAVDALLALLYCLCFFEQPDRPSSFGCTRRCYSPDSVFPLTCLSEYNEQRTEMPLVGGHYDI